MTATVDLEQLTSELATYLGAHPGATRRQLLEAIAADRKVVLAALGQLVERGEARIVPGGKPGEPQRIYLSRRSSSSALEEGVELWKSAARCPTCGKPPNVRFSRREVERARRERQSARLQTVRCPRDGTRYWITARDVAAATIDTTATAA